METEIKCEGLLAGLSACVDSTGLQSILKIIWGRLDRLEQTFLQSPKQQPYTIQGLFEQSLTKNYLQQIIQQQIQTSWQLQHSQISAEIISKLHDLKKVQLQQQQLESIPQAVNLRIDLIEEQINLLLENGLQNSVKVNLQGLEHRLTLVQQQVTDHIQRLDQKLSQLSSQLLKPGLKATRKYHSQTHIQTGSNSQQQQHQFAIIRQNVLKNTDNINLLNQQMKALYDDNNLLKRIFQRKLHDVLAFVSTRAKQRQAIIKRKGWACLSCGKPLGDTVKNVTDFTQATSDRMIWNKLPSHNLRQVKEISPPRKMQRLSLLRTSTLPLIHQTSFRF